MYSKIEGRDNSERYKGMMIVLLKRRLVVCVVQGCEVKTPSSCRSKEEFPDSCIINVENT
jgi:hypothetical protein